MNWTIWQSSFALSAIVNVIFVYVILQLDRDRRDDGK